jgi:hypothetical protein
MLLALVAIKRKNQHIVDFEESGGVSRNPRFFRHSKLSCLRCLDSLDLRPFNSNLTVIEIKNFLFLDLIMESLGDKQAKRHLTEFSGFWAYTPRVFNNTSDRFLAVKLFIFIW